MAFPAWALVGKTGDSACSIGGCVPCANGICVPLGFHPHALQRRVRVGIGPWLCPGAGPCFALWPRLASPRPRPELNRFSRWAASLVGWGLFLLPAMHGVGAGKF